MLLRSIIKNETSALQGLAALAVASGFGFGFGFFYYNSTKKIAHLPTKRKSNEDKLSFTLISPVSTDSDTVYLENMGTKMVDIVLRDRDPKELPYSNAEILDYEKNVALKELQIQRESCDRMVLRGDNRNFEEIHKAGGFNPRFTIDASTVEINPLDIKWHRNNDAAGSGFVSTTTDIKTAHIAGYIFSHPRYGFLCGGNASSYDSEYTIYALNAIGAMTPSPNYYENQKEYSIPGGVDAVDIIAYRQCVANENKEKVEIKCSELFFNNRYKNKFPQAVKPIAESLLLDNEHLPELEFKKLI